MFHGVGLFSTSTTRSRVANHIYMVFAVTEIRRTLSKQSLTFDAKKRRDPIQNAA